jgi:hypothetical protein
MARGAIQKDGTKRYATVIRIGGRQRWKTFDKKKDAEDYLDRNSADVRDGTYREIKKGTFSHVFRTLEENPHHRGEREAVNAELVSFHV